jgi:LPS sulfotransferase NodH
VAREGRSKDARSHALESPPWERLSELEEYRLLCRQRLEHLVPVREPLVLISQVQRSGGTLLAQLLDGHPECHVDPYELKIGHPKKHDWPALDLDRPERWFETLYFRGMSERLRRTERTRRPEIGRSAFPFLFLPRLQRALFERCVAAWRPGSEREVLDCYFTAYFNAWLDDQSLYARPKRAVVGFTPRLAMAAENVERFFAAYPDGLLISIVREPRAWYASALKHMPEHYGDAEAALALWRRSAEAGLAARERYGSRVLLLTYEQLVLEPEATMASVAERIGVAMRPELLTPTFNGMPIRANSSGAVDRVGILPERVRPLENALSPQLAARVDELAGDLYERAAAVAAEAS